MRYGLAIDNRKCIGCHACSVACKAENHVPLGVFRTWVKYVEKGVFPNTRRHFLVTRCNHCEHPPCVAICPVGAMFRRLDGIVDFDSARCIGCKACLQACPYDAVYVDPERKTAAKCHLCAHRIELSLEPTCVAACPARALVTGDLDDPTSDISRLLAREPSRVRRAEIGTEPKVFYLGAEESAIVPGAAKNVGAYLFATVNERANRVLDSHAEPPTPALVAYDVEHKRPWDWQVPVYFFTKSVSTGVLIVPALASALLGHWLSPLTGAALSALGLAFMGLTAALLISDLSRAERFARVLATPQPRSWLARGAFLLVAYTAFLGAFGLSSWIGPRHLSEVLVWPAAILGLLAAVYTAFLFAQCKGCDLWQTQLLPLHLIVQSAITGAAVVLVLPVCLDVEPWLGEIAVPLFVLALGLHVLAVLGEIAMPSPTDSGRRAARLIVRGPLAAAFWVGAVTIGAIAPVVCLAIGSDAPFWLGLAGVCGLLGLLAFEWCFVMAGQGVSNS